MHKFDYVDEKALLQLLRRDFQKARCDGYMVLAIVRRHDLSRPPAVHELAAASVLRMKPRGYR